MMKFVSIFVFLWWAPLALAQDAGPLIGSQASEPQTTLISPTLNDGVMRILVIGDAMAGGLGAGMTRLAQNEASIQIVNRFNESSAITRPDIYDWASAIPKIMDGKDFNVAVMLVGSNDRQDIRSSAGRLTFNTPEWTKAYQANIDAILDALKAENVQIYWLGQPPMGDPAYDADMKLVTALQKERVLAKGAKFFDTRPGLSNPDGSYMEFGPDDTGTMTKLRQRDGVTFLRLGNNKFGQVVLAAIKAGGVTPSATTPDVAAAASDVGGPVFGQDDANGVAVLHDSSTIVVASGDAVPATDASPAASDPLFTSGEAQVAPLGRFDDFSVVLPTAN